MKTFKNLFLLGLFVLLLVPTLLLAAPILQNIPTVTLLVKKYSDIEKELQTAIMQGDITKINTFLDTSFEERDGKNPNNPVPKDEWIDLTIKRFQTTQTTSMQQIAVHEIGNVRIVSYQRTIKSQKPIFVVDVWKVDGTSDRLVVRYFAIV